MQLNGKTSWTIGGVAAALGLAGAIATVYAANNSTDAVQSSRIERLEEYDRKHGVLAEKILNAIQKVDTRLTRIETKLEERDRRSTP